MTTNNEAFDKWWNDNPNRKSISDSDKQFALNVWYSATTEANKRIADSEREIENLKLNIAAQEQLGYELQASNNRLQAKLTAEKEYVNELLKSSNHLFVENEQLKASHSRLREALEENHYSNSSDKAIDLYNKTMFSTPAQSLALHDNELLEQAARVADNMPLNDEKAHHQYRSSDDSKAMAWDIAFAIRALKTEVTK